MDFAVSERAERLRERVAEFMDEHVLPVEAEAIEAWDEEVAPGLPYPPIVVEMRERAKAEGLWNLFLPDERFGPGLSNWEYGLVCETMGRSRSSRRWRSTARRRTRATWRSSPSSAPGTAGAVARAAAGGPHALGLLDDRARLVRLGSDGAPDPGTARRR